MALEWNTYIYLYMLFLKQYPNTMRCINLNYFVLFWYSYYTNTYTHERTHTFTHTRTHDMHSHAILCMNSLVNIRAHMHALIHAYSYTGTVYETDYWRLHTDFLWLFHMFVTTRWQWRYKNGCLLSTICTIRKHVLRSPHPELCSAIVGI